IDAPPFEGYAVTCGLTFTFGGLFYFNYPGGSGLMSGTVFGRIAGTSAGRAGKN
ncbi:MAG TPA: tricarballylate dehydrogenase, partial [Xanthobacteraceae bacterium]|nr:tricarballylate dehydrogenase [Xanthobacteraceae bacterium]